MDSRQIALVQNSFAQIAPAAGKVADLFYARLFQLDPSLRPMFGSDMRKQKQALIATLKFAVLSLTRPDELVPAVQALGRRHAGYGVQPRHYDTVAAALLWTLEQGLGDAFTPEVRAAWVATYTLLAQTMQEAAAAAARPEPAPEYADLALAAD